MGKGEGSSTVFRLFVIVIIHEHVLILFYLLIMHPQKDLRYEIITKAVYAECLVE